MSDPTPVLATLDRISAAWNAGDATAYGAEFTADATYVMFDGRVSDGRRSIEDVHRFLFDGPLRGSRMAPVSDGAPVVRFLRPDVAHVVAGGALGPDRASKVSFVLVDDGDAWRVAAFQNTRVAPVG